jgi:hypothetical protein
VHRCRCRPLLLATFLVLPAFLAACKGNGDGTASAPEPVATTDESLLPRPFELGVSSLPTEASEDAYGDAFALAGSLGDLVLIQRAPTWADFLPGGTISPRTERLTRLERDLARHNDLRLLVAIDPTQPSDRGTLAGLPASLAGRDFSDKDIRASLIAYAKYMALNYKPAYMAIGVEVDLYYARRGDAAFRNFVSVYFEAYDAVKEVSPETQVFPTFQYENVLGLLNGGALAGRLEPGQPLRTQAGPAGRFHLPARRLQRHSVAAGRLLQRAREADRKAHRVLLGRLGLTQRRRGR